MTPSLFSLIPQIFLEIFCVLPNGSPYHQLAAFLERRWDYSRWNLLQDRPLSWPKLLYPVSLRVLFRYSVESFVFLSTRFCSLCFTCSLFLGQAILVSLATPCGWMVIQGLQIHIHFSSVDSAKPLMDCSGSFSVCWGSMLL